MLSEGVPTLKKNYTYFIIFEEIRLAGFEIYLSGNIWLFGEDVYFFLKRFIVISLMQALFKKRRDILLS